MRNKGDSASPEGRRETGLMLGIVILRVCPVYRRNCVPCEAFHGQKGFSDDENRHATWPLQTEAVLLIQCVFPFPVTSDARIE